MAVKNGGDAFYHCADHLKHDKPFVLIAVRHNGSILATVDPVFRNDFEVARAAIRDTPSSIKHVGPDLRRDWNLSPMAVMRNEHVFCFLDDILRGPQRG